jgi:UMF1 family MFS transporter
MILAQSDMEIASAARIALPRAEPAPSRRAVASWALFDLANTIFSTNIISLYFALWVVKDMGGHDSDFALANSLAMALMFCAAPLLGALSDQAARRLPFLAVTTTGCAAFTALLGSGGLLPSLALFVVANCFFQAGVIFYDALLPTVSTEANRGRINGLGVGVGYLGSFVGIALGLTTLHLDPAGKPLVFKLTALCFVLFTLPCFLWVREHRRADATPFGRRAMRQAWRELRGTAERARRYPALTRFLIGRVFYADAANTLITFVGIYATKEIGFSDQQAQLVLLVGIAAAIVGGLLWGRRVDAIGPKRTLHRVLVLWTLTLALTAAIGFFGLPRPLFWLVAGLVGLALGGTWAADRPLMLRLTPPRHLGQFYGLYAMAGRFAAILGPLLWAAIVDGLGLGRPAAVASLVGMIGLAFLVLRPVADAPRAWTDAELVPR